MNLKNAVTVKVARTILQTKKNSPTLMFGIGMVAMVGTVVLASRATLGLEEILAEAQVRDDEPNIKARTAIKIVELYAPAAGVGLVAVGCLTGSHVVLTKRNAALTAAYAGLNKAYNDYRDRVREELGEDKERQLNMGVEEKNVIRDKAGKSVGLVVNGVSYSPYARYFDQMAQNWSVEPEYNRIFLQNQQNYANDKLHSRGHLFLNEVYDALGIPRSKAGQFVGWVISDNGDNYVDFGMFNHNSGMAREFINGYEGSILLDFNVDGVIYELIEKKKG